MPHQPAVDIHPQRDQIIDWMLSGVPCTHIAQRITPRISRVALDKYRNKRIRPAIENAKFIRKGKSLQGLPTETLRQALYEYDDSQATKHMAANVLQADPALARILHRKGLQDGLLVEAAQAKDFKGFAAVNQVANRDDELEARLTGRLDNGPAVVINQFVVGRGAHLEAPSTPVIDIRPADRDEAEVAMPDGEDMA